MISFEWVIYLQWDSGFVLFFYMKQGYKNSNNINFYSKEWMKNSDIRMALGKFLILSMYFWDAIFKGCLIRRNWYVVYLGGLTSSGYRYSFLSYTGRLRTCWPSFPQFSLFLNLKSISYTFPSLFMPRSDCNLTPPRKLKILRRFICLLNRSETKDLLRVNMRKDARENVACTDRKHHRKMSTHILLGENGS